MQQFCGGDKKSELCTAKMFKDGKLMKILVVTVSFLIESF